MSTENRAATPKVMDLKQAAAYSGIPLRALRNLIWERRIKVVQLTRPNGKIFVPTSELDKFLDQEAGFIRFMGSFSW
jgi:hypothetical protein